MENLKSKQSERQQFGLESANALKHAVIQLKPQDSEILYALINRITLCNHNANQFIAENYHSIETGELFDSIGRFWNCGSKLCPSCLASESRKRRKQLQLAIVKQKLLVGENFSFHTLTIPNPGQSLLKTRAIVSRAWELFRKRKYINDSFLGCAKSEEFTFTSRGYHYHLHLLVRSKYINYQLIRQIWTDCLRISFAEIGLELFCNTSDGLAICKILKVSDLKQIVNELCKYITKNESWQNIPTSDLIDIARIKRFPRMFELLGTFRNDPKEKTILDTTDLNDGETSDDNVYWRTCVERFGLKTYLKRLKYAFENAREIRLIQIRAKYPYSTVHPKVEDFTFTEF